METILSSPFYPPLQKTEKGEEIGHCSEATGCDSPGRGQEDRVEPRRIGNLGRAGRATLLTQGPTEVSGPAGPAGFPFRTLGQATPSTRSSIEPGNSPGNHAIDSKQGQNHGCTKTHLHIKLDSNVFIPKFRSGSDKILHQANAHFVISDVKPYAA